MALPHDMVLVFQRLQYLSLLAPFLLPSSLFFSSFSPPLPFFFHLLVSPPFKSSEATDPCLDPYFTIPAAMTFTAQFVELIADTLDQPLPYPLPRHTIIRCHIDQSIRCGRSPPAKILSCRFFFKKIEGLTCSLSGFSLVPRPLLFCFSASV